MEMIQNEHDATREKTHYAKEELQEFRELIQNKLAEARDEYKSLQENLRSVAEVSADSFNMTEFGSEISDKQNAEMMLARTIKHIDALERAMIRIENGSYGRCKVTGQLIPKERLRVVPHTESTIEAKTGK